MPLITIDMFPGRSEDQKRQLAKELTTTFCTITKIKPDGVHIIFRDVEKNSWSFGGQLCSDKFPD
jgi:4-oxalocrotonate tautomerase